MLLKNSSSIRTELSIGGVQKAVENWYGVPQIAGAQPTLLCLTAGQILIYYFRGHLDGDDTSSFTRAAGRRSKPKRKISPAKTPRPENSLQRNPRLKPSRRQPRAYLNQWAFGVGGDACLAAFMGRLFGRSNEKIACAPAIATTTK
jgi:hypothetical protein